MSALSRLFACGGGQEIPCQRGSPRKIALDKMAAWGLASARRSYVNQNSYGTYLLRKGYDGVSDVVVSRQEFFRKICGDRCHRGEPKKSHPQKGPCLRILFRSIGNHPRKAVNGLKRAFLGWDQRRCHEVQGIPAKATLYNNGFNRDVPISVRVWELYLCMVSRALFR